MYETPYKKPTILVEILDGREGDDDQFYGTRDWEATFLKSKNGEDEEQS